jgi:glutamine synthetase
MDDILYYFNASSASLEEIKQGLEDNPNIKFVSLAAVDLGNNHTDERIPIDVFLDDMDSFLKYGVQTDGSSVNLRNIAVINNAKVDIIPDKSVKWLIDYNYDNIDPATGLPTGTLTIPSFLKHDDRLVDSRSILKRAQERFESEMKHMVNDSQYLRDGLGFQKDERIDRVVLTSATELEFWVKTPGHKSDVEQLSTSQILKEQYWKRTIGPVRTALENALLKLNDFGFNAEMGHKEVGGIPASLIGSNAYDHIMEQLEVDWKFDEALQSADNELFAREIIKETFVKLGLEVTFLAKPIEGVAGSGEHHHMGAGAITTSGRFVNLFSPVDLKKHFMSSIGFGALMGLLKNYEVINPFVTASNDAFNRLKPGFEAPVCTVACLGHSEDIPTRNRTVLVGLVRDVENPKATRFELRSPNPYSNTYLTIASSFQSMLDGIRYVTKAEKSYDDLLLEISKLPGEKSDYLEKGRMYRSEEDVFEHYTAEQRSKYFGNPPSTVWENMISFDKYPEKVSILKDGDVFTDSIVDSYAATYLDKWHQELRNRIIPYNMDIIRDCVKIHDADEATDLDVVNWEKINALRFELMKDSLSKKSLFTRIREAVDSGDFDKASALQLEMSAKMSLLLEMYSNYKHNLLIIQ